MSVLLLPPNIEGKMVIRVTQIKITAKMFKKYDSVACLFFIRNIETTTIKRAVPHNGIKTVLGYKTKDPICHRKSGSNNLI